MKTIETLKCMHCGADLRTIKQPWDTGRAICGTCTLSGKTFPRDTQVEFPQLQSSTPEAA